MASVAKQRVGEPLESIYAPALGEFIQEWRERKGMSQGDLIFALRQRGFHTCESILRHWEHGRQRFGTLALLTILHILEVPHEDWATILPPKQYRAL